MNRASRKMKKERFLDRRDTLLLLTQLILFFTAFSKTLFLMGRHAFLGLNDGIFPFLTQREVVAFAAFAKWGALIVLYSQRIPRILKWLLVYGLGWCFVWYRLIKWIEYGETTCLCVGLLSWNSPFMSWGLWGIACFLIGVGGVKGVREILEKKG